jgi:hypothetical protein
VLARTRTNLAVRHLAAIRADIFRQNRADSVFGKITKRHDDGAITVMRIDGKEQVIEAREARRCASCRVGDFVEHELRYDKSAQCQVASRARPLETVVALPRNRDRRAG